MADLFALDTPRKQWLEFSARGFPMAVPGIIFNPADTSCGIPLGGLGTGCMDLNTDGLLGRCSIFNSFAPPRELGCPFSALTVASRTWTLSTQPLGGLDRPVAMSYWGHYPVADIEYDLGGPVGVGLRSWSPFILGDAEASNTPAIIFEFHLRNLTASPQTCRLTLAFPGPTSEERDRVEPRFHTLQGTLQGVQMAWAEAGLLLGTADSVPTRAGGLSPEGRHFISPVAFGAGQSGVALAADVELGACGHRLLRFFLAWYCPRWAGSSSHHYRHAYARRFHGVEEVVRFVAQGHPALLERILQWQSRVYNLPELPVWLRDQLVNILHTVAEDSSWACESIPSEDWYGPTGIFALTESPRTTPHVCSPSDWYGGLPIVFFFPELAASLLRSYVHFQLPTGEIPLGIGERADLANPVYRTLHTLNGSIFVHLVDRLWQRDLDRATLIEFYPSVKRAIQFTQGLDRDTDALPDLEPDPVPNQFYGRWTWRGTAIHVNGLWLAALAMAERMAHAIGDRAFAADCALWRQVAGQSVENKLWAGSHYLVYKDAATGDQSDTVLANQLAGQLCADLHGLEAVFPQERISATLDTVLRLCGQTSFHGIANALRQDGSWDRSGHPQSDGVFTGESIAVSATLAYAGKTPAALSTARSIMYDIVIRQGAAWDMPNLLDPVTGGILHGTDFYQMMILWALPLALAGEDIHRACAKEGVIGKVFYGAMREPESGSPVPAGI
jgi:uncharacterized protein (DUF608 family)